MQTVTDNFQAAACATVRRPKAKVEITWTPTEFDNDVTVTADPAENRGAQLDQVYDGDAVTPHAWAHFGKESGVEGIPLDGTRYLSPSAESSSNQIGWFGSVRGDASGEWVTDPELTIEFNARPVLQLHVTGDTAYGEYPVDFDVEVYEGVTLSHTEVVTGNAAVTWTANVSSENLTSVTKMILVVKKWSVGERIVKVNEFYTAFIETFEGDDVASMYLLEERMAADGSLPIGNISCNEIDLALQNINVNDAVDPFFPSNTNSTYHEVVVKNRRVAPYLGFQLPDDSIEYVALGVFWTGDWTVNEQSGIATVACRDRLELLRAVEFKGSELYQDATLYDLMITVLSSARSETMPGLQWDVDTELRDYVVPWAWFPKATYFKTIKTIVEACQGLAYMSRDDILTVEGPTALTR